ncbi:hypothetical protein GCM10011415_28200 [Salipiger pallidus]|uniref:Uncharacterized protein n=1 Tax=Salipiger pallidus TaxID=1775170 RepID=A0A8J2ZLM8_9RHOB|nr:hypothetical protein [Salipiger pallidus]GGG77647.1 hypothetical protein GCM10011415_28200 [Salipiger pallidus]
MSVVYVDSCGSAWLGRDVEAVASGRAALEAGLCRLAASGAACRDILARATPPERCSREIPIAPARRTVIAEVPRRADMTEAGPRVRRDDGGLGDRARQGDVFDVMDDQARRRHRGVVAQARRAYLQRCEEAAERGQPEPVWRPPFYTGPFSSGQIAMARDYAALTERCNSSGLKCSSLEALRSSGGGGGDREEAMLRDMRRLRALHHRIGDGLAQEVRRIRPGGRKRKTIRARVLVDQVCLGGLSLSQVLQAHGWAVDAKSRYALRAALRSALERMQRGS